MVTLLAEIENIPDVYFNESGGLQITLNLSPINRNNEPQPETIITSHTVLHRQNIASLQEAFKNKHPNSKFTQENLLSFIKEACLAVFTKNHLNEAKFKAFIRQIEHESAKEFYQKNRELVLSNYNKIIAGDIVSL